MAAHEPRFKFQHEIEFVPMDVSENHKRMDAWLESGAIDCIVISAQDAFLSEYNTLGNNQRYALSGFKGSTGDGIFVSRSLRQKLNMTQPFILFVDGRYHLQADLETDKNLVNVVKLTLDETIEGSILKWVKDLKVEKAQIGFDSYRTSSRRKQALQQVCETRGFSNIGFMQNDISKTLELPGWKVERDIFEIDEKLTGRSADKNYRAVTHELKKQSQKFCLMSCAADDAAWFLNARGYHTPFHSSFLAYTFVLPEKVILFLPEGVEKCQMKVAKSSSFELEVIRNDLNALKKALTAAQVDTVFYNELTTNAFLPQLAAEIWPKSEQIKNCLTIESLRAIKTPEECHSLRDSFLKSSRAISRTMRWVKEHSAQATADKTSLSEYDLAQKIASEYKNEGALELSFNTIAGTGEHGAIIHYGTPQKDTAIKVGDLVLLDSGAYYEAGLATDCTRVVWANGLQKKPESWQTDIYTTVLKSCVAGMRAKFKTSTSGKDIDAKARQVCQQAGYDYGHGTGHGVGIHVHEAGIRFSTISNYNCTPFAAVSMEPGIYLSGKGGVRLENVVIVTPRDDEAARAGKDVECEFENLVFVGFDWDVIDVSRLNDDEKSYLRDYELKCKSLGTYISNCPLI